MSKGCHLHDGIPPVGSVLTQGGFQGSKQLSLSCFPYLPIEYGNQFQVWSETTSFNLKMLEDATFIPDFHLITGVHI